MNAFPTLVTPVEPRTACSLSMITAVTAGKDLQGGAASHCLMDAKESPAKTVDRVPLPVIQSEASSASVPRDLMAPRVNMTLVCVGTFFVTMVGPVYLPSRPRSASVQMNLLALCVSTRSAAHVTQTLVTMAARASL